MIDTNYALLKLRIIKILASFQKLKESLMVVMASYYLALNNTKFKAKYSGGGMTT